MSQGLASNVAFQDLWHLYTSASEVISNGTDGNHQVSRILHVSGGRPFLCGRSQARMHGSEGKDQPTFEISTYFYSSDGSILGMCQGHFLIKSYKGTKAITTLPCYPIVYAKVPRGLKPREFFVNRGRRFLELTRSNYTVHKRYDGLTLSIDDNQIREQARHS